MSVVDASVLVDALVVAGTTGAAARSVLAGSPVLRAPSILTAEATSAVRSMWSRRDIDTTRARAAVAAIGSVRVESYPFEPFIDRVWELRSNLTVYDAWYVALAESLECELLTADSRLARASGPRCRVVEVGG